MGLIFVPTPLGNRGDITLRALDALRACELLVAEDTRTARRLLALYDLPLRPMLSYREQNAAAVTESILARASEANVVVVTDAGMPGISDPGRELVVAARAAGIGVEVLPGAVAFVVAAVLSGFPLDDLRFGGFFPRAAGERRRAAELALASGATYAWYESPHRIVAALETFAELSPDARLFVARELTKVHEQHLFGTAREIADGLARPIRGEIVLIAGPVAPAPVTVSSGDTSAAIDGLLAEGRSTAEIARALVKRGFGDRADLYRRVIERRGLSPTEHRS